MLRGRNYASVNAVDVYESKKVKRYRSAFTTSQISYLEKQFEKCPYIGSTTRKEVANLLDIPERAIKIWFQNRRMKEKKEVSNKEYNINYHKNSMNNKEFASGSLNNVSSTQSANDHQCSLQPKAAKHVDIVNCTNYYDDATFSKSKSGIDNMKKETIDYRKSPKYENVSNIKKNVERTFLSPVSLVNSDLYKKYTNRNLANYIEFHKRNAAKGKTMPKTNFKTRKFEDSLPNTSLPQSRYQDLPEDLSSRNLSNVVIPGTHQSNLHFRSAYIPFCNSQDVCLPAGNVIWKPVNVMPTVSQNPIPGPVQDRQPSINQNTEQKCECSCNCHSTNRLNYSRGNIEPPPQYVIAIPYNNNINILR